MASVETITTTQLILIAGCGGFILNMMNIWEDSKKPKAERIPKEFTWWVFFMFWPVAGAGLAWLYALDGSALRPLLAFSIGLSAPTTLQTMVAKAAAVAGPPSNSEP